MVSADHGEGWKNGLLKLSKNLQVNEPNNKTTGAQESFSQTPKVGLKKGKKKKKKGKNACISHIEEATGS